MNRPLLNAAKFVRSELRAMRLQIQSIGKPYRHVASYEYLIRPYILQTSTSSIALDLGCGRYPKNPFFAKELRGIDSREDLGSAIYSADLAMDKIPFEDNTFDYCTAFDFIEHIPRSIVIHQYKTLCPFIELMNEIHRVLRPGGLFLHQTPAFPSPEAFQDPTHVNYITENTFPDYFCRPKAWAHSHGYGFRGAFELLDQAWLDRAWLVGLMRCIK